MACVLKLINPKIKIIGVEPTNSNVMTRSIESNKPELFDTNKNKTIADTLAAPFAGDITFEFVKRYVDDIINVSEKEMVESLKLIIERLKIVPEPSAAACFVPILKKKVRAYKMKAKMKTNEELETIIDEKRKKRKQQKGSKRTRIRRNFCSTAYDSNISDSVFMGTRYG